MEAEFETEFMSLPLEDLQEEYGKLFDRYRQLRDDAEGDAQRIHELRRSLETATAAEAYLSQELEQLTTALAAYDTESNALCKAQSELDDLRRKHHTLSVDYATLQQDYENLRDENAALRKQADVLRAAKQQDAVAAVDTLAAEEQTKRLNVLECENLELLQKLEEFQENSVRQTMALADREKNIEILRDQVNCLEENLRSKREDLDEKTNLLESAQEQLSEANARIAALTTVPDNVERKGNSLFAEVDDQRQAMKQLLAAQKKSYVQMKKIFHDSQYEIRRLKRENIAMHTELRECSSIFCNADKTYQDKLNERIRHLLSQVDGLERQLSLTQERLKELASEKGVVWLDSMLNFCKQETSELKKQLHSVRIQKASLEEQLRNVQQDMARWRFESLKSRCVLLDRENLLNEHSIAFKAMNALEFCIGEKEQQAARPRIVNATPSKASPAVTVVKQEVTLESTTNNIEDVSTISIAEMSLVSGHTPIKTVSAHSTPDEDKENAPPEAQNTTEKLQTVASQQSPLPAFELSSRNCSNAAHEFARDSQLQSSKNISATNSPFPKSANKSATVSNNQICDVQPTKNVQKSSSASVEPCAPTPESAQKSSTVSVADEADSTQWLAPILNAQEPINELPTKLHRHLSAALNSCESYLPSSKNGENVTTVSETPVQCHETYSTCSEAAEKLSSNPNSHATPVPRTRCAKKLPPDANAQPGPSILSKGRDIFSSGCNEKNVQFSAQAPAVHDISVDTNLSTGIDAAPVDSNEDVKQHKVTIKQVRTKSNIVVRRVVLGARQARN